jgi:DNA-binding response OmpR family regulator
METRTVGICDDDPAILDCVAALLQSAGYRVFTAHHHEELARKLQEHSPDLLILDIRMPEHDGCWIAEGLQALGHKIPIIFLTGYDSLIYRLYAPFVGAVTYLTKPVDLTLLLSKVREVLDRSVAHNSAEIHSGV